MAGDDHPPPSRPNFKPAAFIGGQRRRLVRRSALPRSSTTPVLSGPATTTSSTTSNMATASVSALPDPLTPITETTTAASSSPTSSNAADSKNKKRAGHRVIDVLKPKDRSDGSDSLGSRPVQTSPLPPLTPKIAKLLGVNVAEREARSTHADYNLDNGNNEGSPVRPTLHKRSSLPLLTRKKDAAGKPTRFKEEGVEETDSTTSSAFMRSMKQNLKEGNKKAMRMLDIIPSLPVGSKWSHKNADQDLSPLSSRSEEDLELGYSSDSEIQPHPAPEPMPAPKRKPRKKKGPKSLETMSTITEASLSEDGALIYEDGDGVELEVISEYAVQHPTRRIPSLPKSYTESELPRQQYELAPDEISTSEDNIEEIDTNVEEYTVNFLGEPSARPPQLAIPERVQRRGPLQEVEHRLLDDMERCLQVNEEKRKILDVENSRLRQGHLKMKSEFREIKARSVIQDQQELGHNSKTYCLDCTRCNSDLSDDEHDNGCMHELGSDVDSDEEPIVHEAEALTFMRVTPGMVKLVDIPPRKSKAIPTKIDVPPIKVASNEVKLIYDFKQGDEVGTPQQHKENTGKVIQGSDANYRNRVGTPKKDRVPKEESWVQGWVNDYNNTQQRPLSERIDADVLADQEIAPAPVPKDDAIMKPKAPPKHKCVLNNHHFRPINLRQVPDEVAINSLGVRPYLHTHTGIKQHVHVPVLCQVCEKDVKEVLWECEIPACRMVVCRTCAMEMEIEWENRVVDE